MKTIQLVEDLKAKINIESKKKEELLQSKAKLEKSLTSSKKKSTFKSKSPKASPNSTLRLSPMKDLQRRSYNVPIGLSSASKEEILEYTQVNN